MADIAPVILAAGDSSRMGFPKALLPLGAGTFLTHILDTLDTLDLQAARVVLGRHETLIRPMLISRRVHVLVNPSPERGQFSSMHQALESLSPGCAGCLIWPVDQPAISAGLVRGLLQLFLNSSASLAMPSCKGKAGHPVIFGGGLITELLAAPPDANPKLIIAGHRDGAAYLPTEERNTVEDIDDPDDYFKLTGEDLKSALARQGHGSWSGVRP